MKKIYFLLFLFSVGAFAQNITITKVIETGCSNPFVKTVELYVDGTVDFANDDVTLNYMQNGGAWSDNQIDISALGIQTDAFVYIVRDIPLMEAEFPSTTFDSSNTVVVNTATNGDDGYQVVLNGAVVSQFGETQTDGTGTPWEHVDAVATRLDGIPDNGTFDVSHWAITEINSTDSQTACEGGNGLEAWFDTLGGTFPLGSGSGWTPDCTTFLGADSVECNSQNVGLSDDVYSASLDFTGANNGNTFVITVNEGAIGGDDPTTAETGTITVSDIPEGTDLVITVSDLADGGVCELTREIASPGCVPLVLNEALYDPPNDLAGDANNDGTRDPLEDEFIEFFNNSSEALDISGYTIFDTNAFSSNTPRHIVPENTVIPANGAYVVFGGGTPTGSFGTAIVQTASSGQLNLSNNGDQIIVKNQNDQIVLVFNSEDYSLDFGDDQSITRNPDITGDFVLHTDANPDLLYSPGLQINGDVLSTEEITQNQDVKLYPNPVQNGKLFIEGNQEISVIHMYNLTGKKVLTVKQANIENVDVSGLNAGMYIITIESNQHQIHRKIIIE